MNRSSQIDIKEPHLVRRCGLSTLGGTTVQAVNLWRHLVFWKKKKKINPDNAPRAHHYEFAHIALRAFCDNDPLSFFAAMASVQRDDFIRFVWEKVCEQCDKKEKPDFSEKDIKIITLKIGPYPTILVQMPEAKAMAEAMMIGIVLVSNSENSREGSEASYRYFVLEQGMDASGSARTVFCEWVHGDHVNMGDGPEATVASFLERISQSM